MTLDGESLTERDVTSWALANLPPSLQKLRQDLMSEAPAADATLAKLLALVSERKIITAEAAAVELAMPAEEVNACALRHPIYFGILDGPPLVLFEAVAGFENVAGRLPADTANA